MAAIVALLKFLEYRYIIRDLQLEIYLGIIALLFTIFGIWMGLKLVDPSPTKGNLQNGQATSIDLGIIKQLQISGREYEVLQLIVDGYSNQEIADRLFVSLSTVKTHSSNLFVKLDVKRRTQAIQKAKELNII